MLLAPLLMVIMGHRSCESHVHLEQVTWLNSPHPVQVTFSGNTSLVCTGNYLEWENVGVFTPTITLEDGAAEAPLALSFDIQGAKDIGSDRLGLLAATWAVGDVSASSFIYVTQAPASGTTVPEGAVSLTDGFWLGCTKVCAVRGNAGKTGTSARDVYFESRRSDSPVVEPLAAHLQPGELAQEQAAIGPSAGVFPALGQKLSPEKRQQLSP